jgi:hypothetical protein
LKIFCLFYAEGFRDDELSASCRPSVTAGWRCRRTLLGASIPQEAFGAPESNASVKMACG